MVSQMTEGRDLGSSMDGVEIRFFVREDLKRSLKAARALKISEDLYVLEDSELRKVVKMD